MNCSYQKDFFIPFHLADPAGVVFFAHVFTLAHQMYEEFVIDQLGITWSDWFQNSQAIVPIVSTQAKYMRPLQAGCNYSVQMCIKEMRESSFSIEYLFKSGEELHCVVETVHVYCDRKTRKKELLPESLKLAFLRK